MTSRALLFSRLRKSVFSKHYPSSRGGKGNLTLISVASGSITVHRIPQIDHDEFFLALNEGSYALPLLPLSSTKL